MSTIRTPVGPQPPAVYWKRRAIVLIGLLAVIVIILLIVFRPGGNAPTPTNTSTAGAGASNAPVDTDVVPDCTADQVQLTAVTDKPGYNAGEEPLLSMTITNMGAAPCTIDASTNVQQYIIASGSEQYWSSQDCQGEPVTAEAVLEPGVPKSTAPFAWDRTRSSTTTCDASRPPVSAGGASYHLTVKLGELESENTKQFLLY
jgi:hypothetical protein